MTAAPAARPLCPRCQRPLRRCLCPLVVPVANQVPVRLLQHPLEQHQAKGSARLLSLCLARCDTWVGEQFAPEALATWLGQPPSGSALRPWLLYPEAGAEPLRSPPCTLAPPQPTEPGTAPGLQLVVLDATWRKSRKMLALNPQLAALPRLALPPQSVNRYAALRKAQQTGQLATLEATALALAWLEGQPARYAPLLAAFEGFVALQSDWPA